MCGRLDSYIISFSHLKTGKDKSRWTGTSNYRSPAKPLLLLSVIDHIAAGLILRNFISPSIELEQTYTQYFEQTTQDSTPIDMAEPFYDLAKTPFWELRPRSAQQYGTDQDIRSIMQFTKSYYGAKFSEDLFMLLQMQHSRKMLYTALIKSHFSSEFKNKIKHFSTSGLL